MNSFARLPRPFFVLAPMDDVTDTVFRRVVGSCAPPDLFFTEFVNVDGLQSPGRQHLIKKLLHSAAQHEAPLIAQLWGKKPENFRKTAAELADPGSELNQLATLTGYRSMHGQIGESKLAGEDAPLFAGIDLNMGCPAKSEVNNGTCSALINNRPLALEIIQATQQGSAGKVPVSVKTRLGFSTVDMTWPELLLQQNLDMLTIHGRTRKEMSKVPAHWDLIGQVKELRDKLYAEGSAHGGDGRPTLVVGNGDVRDRQHGLELVRQYGLDGIMVGRGVFANPFCFAEDAAEKWAALGRRERLELFKTHVELFAETWQHQERPIHTLNKFCKIYVSDFDGAKELRETLMAANDTAGLLKIITGALQ